MQAAIEPAHRGHYYDGRSARRHEVEVRILALPGAGHMLELRGAEVSRLEALRALEISEPLRNAPLRIAFGDGAVCEVEDGAPLHAALERAGHAANPVARIQGRWAAILVSCVCTLLVAVAAWRWGLPWVADRAARAAPPELADLVGRTAVENLDRFAFSPSALAPARQREIRARFDALRAPGGERIAHELLFRRSDALGANAFAFPSGQIVLTDELVQLAQHDEEILGVLCHELGHVRERHGLRVLFESSVVGLASAWFLGDVSSVLAGAPAALLQAAYSRDAEAQADRDALRMMRENAIPPAALADMLERLERSHAGRTEPGHGTGVDYLASHPATAERIRILRSGGKVD
jgi:hypothetical protein